MLDKVLVVIAYTALAFVGLTVLPYLLWRVWGKRIPFKRKARGLDFNPSASTSEG